MDVRRSWGDVVSIIEVKGDEHIEVLNLIYMECFRD
jgi:hypothetical protein